MPLAIRLATLEDAGLISQLILRVSHFFTLKPDGTGAEKFFETVTPVAICGYIQDERYRYYVAEIDGQLVGIVAVRDHRHLYHLMVAAQAQKRGYARQLWMHAYRLARAEPGGNTFTVNSSLFARPFYEKIGFKTSETVQELHGLAYLPMALETD